MFHKGNIVADVCCGLHWLRCLCALRSWLWWHGWRAVLLRALCLVIAPAQHFHFVDDDVVCRAFDAVFALVFTALDAAFQIYLAAFFQVLPSDFSKAAIHGNVMPFNSLLTLPALVFPAFTRGDAEITDSLAVWHIADFRVSPQSPN